MIIDEMEEPRLSNDTLPTAKEVSLNCTIRGMMNNDPTGDTDIYKVAVKAGQQVSVEVESVNIADQHYGDSEFDLALRILDESGKELASDDDNSFHIQDPMTSVFSTKDCNVYVEIKRSVFSAHNTLYCVHIGDHKQYLAAYPMGGPINQELQIDLLGDPTGTVTTKIATPAVAGTFSHFSGGASPLSLRANPYGNIFEGSNEHTTVDQFPIALNGKISKGEIADKYRLKVKKGDRWLIRVYASALGIPIDPTLEIRPLKDDGSVGELELKKDDATLPERDILGTSIRAGGGKKDVFDPSFVWEPKLEGDYELLIQDQDGSQSDYKVYRIEIEPLITKFHSVLTSETFDWTESTRVTGLAVPKGNRWTVNLSMPQGQWESIASDFYIVAKGLPAGVTMISPLVKHKTTYWPIQFVAAESAEFGSSLITFEARLANNNETIESHTQQNVPFLNHSGGGAWGMVSVAQHVLAVTEPAPFKVEVEPPKNPLLRNGELPIAVKIIRQPGFNEAVTFDVGFVHKSISYQPMTTIPAGQSEGTLFLSAKDNAPLESLPLVVIASTVNEEISPYLGAGHIRVSSEIVYLDIAEPYINISCHPNSIRRGESKKLTWDIQKKTPFEGEAKVSLLGLPKGVNVRSDQVITDASKIIDFDITATDEALLGLVNDLKCELKFNLSGQEIILRMGRGRLRIDPAIHKLAQSKVNGDKK